jgi:hypothetical protein
MLSDDGDELCNVQVGGGRGERDGVVGVEGVGGVAGGVEGVGEQGEFPGGG